MGQYTSYYLYQKYEKRGDQPFTPVYPMEYSVDGNGTMPLVTKNDNDPNCGYSGDTPSVQYRWVNAPINVDYVCDECPEVQYRWVTLSGQYVCSGTTKYTKEQKQVSYDGGETWSNLNEYRAGTVIEYNSEDCGYVEPIYRWVDVSGYVCSGTTKYNRQQRQVSYDGGTTWENLNEYRAGSTVIEYDSTDCGYVPPTEPIYRWVDTDAYICESEEPPTPSGDATKYLTFEVVSSGTIVWKSNGCETKTISYSRDSGSTWTQITSSTAGTSFNVSAGDKILFKGTNSSYGGGCNGPVVGFGTFGDSSAAFNVYGNIMSLIYGDNFSGQTQFPSGSEYNFNSLFASASTVLSAENLILPVTSLTHGCYSDMFAGCTSLTSAPELPATTLAITCYGGMFAGCTSLTTAPTLPATTLARNCYYQMFNECTSLTQAPELPAPTVLTGSYIQMFWNCASLNYIKCLATDVSASGSTFMWTNGVASTGTFIKASSMSSWATGEDGIPSGWTVQNAS